MIDNSHLNTESSLLTALIESYNPKTEFLFLGKRTLYKSQKSICGRIWMWIKSLFGCGSFKRVMEFVKANKDLFKTLKPTEEFKKNSQVLQEKVRHYQKNHSCWIKADFSNEVIEILKLTEKKAEPVKANDKSSTVVPQQQVDLGASAEVTTTTQLTTQTELPQPPVTTPDKFDLTKVDKEKLIQYVNEDYTKIKEHRSNEQRPIKYYAGKHMRVFEYESFPGVIIKLCSGHQASDMLQGLKMAQEKTSDLNFCHIPQAEVVELPNKADVIVIMEKLEGCTQPMECRDLSEREYEKFAEDPSSLIKWREYFKQAAEFICRTGYWDVDWRNILLMKNGLGFIDFEKVDGKNLKGLARLLEMAPVESFNDILEIGRQYKQTDTKMLSRTNKEKRKAELEVHSKVRAWHKHKNIQTVQAIDPQEFAKESVELGIIKDINDSFDRNKDYSYYRGCLIEQRRLHCQPLSDIKKEDYDAALKNLQEKDIICTWVIEENSFQPHLHVYEIYC